MREVLDVAAEELDADTSSGRFAGQPRVESASRGMVGRVYGALGEPALAVPHLRAAAELAGEADGAHAPATWRATSELAEQLRRVGELAAAVPRPRARRACRPGDA